MNIYTTYFNNISTIFDTTTRGVSAKSPQHAVAKSSQHNVKSSSYDDKTKAGITEIINKYIKIIISTN